MKSANSPALGLVLITLFSAAVASGSSNGGQAAVKLVNASATISQTSDTQWTLKKTGELDTSAQTVTWTITATEGNTVSGHLVVYGFLTVANTGAKPATIGNIVVNLQSKFGSSWETQSSDIADATHGDNATSALVDPKASSENEGQFSTNSASGKLDFMDANDNTVFSLEPQKTIAPGASVNLLFSAGFDNNTLKLSDGEAVRAEVIVSFGNAGPQQPSASNVDINGNGVIDQNEAWIRSIPARITMTVPSEIAGNQSVTLTDTASDIATTGTATFSNPSFSLGSTSGTVMVNYDGGTSGGKLTNCAHLKSASSTITVGSYQFPNVNGIDLQACDTETITANSSVTAGWNSGDLTTYDRVGWDSDPNSKLSTNFFNVYPGGLELGGSPYMVAFSSSDALLAYLPSVGTPGALTQSVSDPTDTSAGVFGGDVIALRLDVDFADAALLTANSGLKFGDLTICGLTSDTALNGQSVRSFLSIDSSLLGGGTSGTFTAADIISLDAVTSDVSAAFSVGAPSTWAQQHLFNGACPVWKTGDLTTEDQFDWNLDPSSVLANNFGKVYGGASLVIGTPTYFLGFTDALAILAYLPGDGSPGPLTSIMSEPIDSSSGVYGADVLALQLDVDYADAGVLSAGSGLKFGDLRICGLTTSFYGGDVSGLNGTTVRDFLAIDNALLGASSAGSFTAANILDLDDVTWEASASFDGGPMGYSPGTPSTWAQQHLRNGACQ